MKGRSFVSIRHASRTRYFFNRHVASTVRRFPGVILMKRILFFTILFLTASIAGLAQGTTSRISGVATDASGAVVPNASVTATNDDTGISYSTKTSASGTYSFDSLQIGRYTVRAEAPGFRPFVSTGNVLAIGVPTSIDPKFQIGGASESVEVQGGYNLVETESSGNFGAVIDNITLTQLPIVATRGRNPLGLTQYIPGVVQNNSANAPGGDIVVNGSRDRAFNYVLDGIDDNETSSGGSNTSPSHQNPDMLAEFRVITSNPTAEFGRNSGAQILMVTKSGTNTFHGNLFEFYQSPFLQANTPAAKAVGHPRPQFVQNIYGGSLGGPIWRDKAFFFANVELLHALSSSPVTRTVYTAAARNGQFRYVTSPNGALKNGNAAAPVTSTTAPSVDANGNPILPFTTYNIATNDPFHVGLDPAIKAYLALTPLPNNFTVGDGLNTAGLTLPPRPTTGRWTPPTRSTTSSTRRMRCSDASPQATRTPLTTLSTEDCSRFLVSPERSTPTVSRVTWRSTTASAPPRVSRTNWSSASIASDMPSSIPASRTPLPSHSP